jgi:hypothetical protein
MVFYFCPVIVAIGFFICLQRLTDPGIDFSPYRDRISVVESRMNLQTNDIGPWVNVVVVLTNKSNIAWKDVQTDLRFYNPSGTLIDATEYWSRGVIYPKEEIAFRIKHQPSHDLAEYDSYKIFVRSARDARAHF